MIYNPTVGEFRKATSEILKDTDLMNKILNKFLRMQGEDRDVVRKYAKDHLDKTNFCDRIADYVEGVVSDAQYEHFRHRI